MIKRLSLTANLLVWINLISRLGTHGFVPPTTVTNTPSQRDIASRGICLASQWNLRRPLPRTNENVSTGLSATPGIGPDGCQLPAPSKVNTLPVLAQAKASLGVYAGLALGASLLASALHDASVIFSWWDGFQKTWSVTLGPIFVAAGVSHFLVEDDYCNIYPPPGTWGYWYLPGSAKFHVRWTGVAEILGGLGLLVGGLLTYFDKADLFSPLTQAGLVSDSAAALFLLTCVVTPANLYMYTHGARLPMEAPPVPVTFHAIRGVFQILLLALFLELGAPTFEILLQGF